MRSVMVFMHIYGEENWNNNISRHQPKPCEQRNELYDENYEINGYHLIVIINIQSCMYYKSFILTYM